MLARARELQDHGAAPELLLVTADAALERHPEASPLHSELQLVRMEALTKLGRDVDALAQAQVYLETGTTLRQQEVLELAARLAWNTGGCDAAISHLEQLAAVSPSVATMVKLADCRTSRDPDTARQALEQALEMDPDPRWAAAIQQRLGQL
jgi:tetratricopeptide (TPR) repeat protein